MKILVLQHAVSEHPGSFRDFMHADGLTWDAVELDEGEPLPPAEGYDVLMSFGGPMDVWEEDIHPWIAQEKALIREWVLKGKPFLGVCLGHQMLAEAMGGKVGRMEGPEVGVCEVSLTSAGQTSPLFRGFEGSFPTLQWHGAAIQALPEGAKVLAQNAHCPIQAIQMGPRAFGIQYHVEIVDSTVSDWGAIPEYKCALEAVTGEGGQDRLQAAVDGRMPEFRRAAERLYTNFREVMRG